MKVLASKFRSKQAIHTVTVSGVTTRRTAVLLKLCLLAKTANQPPLLCYECKFFPFSGDLTYFVTLLEDAKRILLPIALQSVHLGPYTAREPASKLNGLQHIIPWVMWHNMYVKQQLSCTIRLSLFPFVAFQRDNENVMIA